MQPSWKTRRAFFCNLLQTLQRWKNGDEIWPMFSWVSMFWQIQQMCDGFGRLIWLMFWWYIYEVYDTWCLTNLITSRNCAQALGSVSLVQTLFIRLLDLLVFLLQLFPISFVPFCAQWQSMQSFLAWDMWYGAMHWPVLYVTSFEQPKRSWISWGKWWHLKLLQPLYPQSRRGRKSARVCSLNRTHLNMSTSWRPLTKCICTGHAFQVAQQFRDPVSVATVWKSSTKIDRVMSHVTGVQKLCIKLPHWDVVVARWGKNYVREMNMGGNLVPNL